MKAHAVCNTCCCCCTGKHHNSKAGRCEQPSQRSLAACILGRPFRQAGAALTSAHQHRLQLITCGQSPPTLNSSVRS